MEGSGKNVLIIGGTGFLGYHAGLELLKRNYRVTALAIPDVDHTEWFPGQIPVISCDVHTVDDDELNRHLEGFDCLVYAMGPDDRSVPDAPADEFYDKKLVKTSARVFAAAASTGIRRAVLLGSYFAYFHRKWPQLRLDEKHPYIRARIRQSEAVLSASGPEMDTMILELPYIFGTMPGRLPLWKETFLDRLLLMNPVLYPAGGSSMICVENAAEAIAGALAHGKPGARYPIGDMDIRWKEMFGIMFKAIGIRRRVVHIPHWIASLGGKVLINRYRKRGKESGLHLAHVFRDILSRNFYIDPAPSAGILRYGSGDVRASIAKTARACYPSGYKKSKQ
jgi:nucleoside-diphosphate-sugar epimerase